MKFKLIFTGFVLFVATFASADTFNLPAIEVIPIKDTANDRDYELYIKLPEDYEKKNTEKKHPVIYIADARWHIEIISGSAEYLVKDAILVGVSWELGIPIQQSRMRDYMPNKYTEKDYKHPTGLAKEHLDFFRNHVFKYVESEYRVDKEQRTYFGYSASGTFGSYVLLTQPETFRNYIIGSPAPLFGGYFSHEYEPFVKTLPPVINANVFVSVGADEKPRYVENAFSFMRFLKARKSEQSRLDFSVIDSADHGVAFPMSAMKGLYWLAKLPTVNGVESH